MLNTLGWAEAVLTSPPEIREELSAKPHLLYQQGVSASGLVSSVVDTSATVVTTLTQCACPNLLVLISVRLWISQKIDPKDERKVFQKRFLSLPFSKIALYEHAGLW